MYNRNKLLFLPLQTDIKILLFCVICQSVFTFYMLFCYAASAAHPAYHGILTILINKEIKIFMRIHIDICNAF